LRLKKSITIGDEVVEIDNDHYKEVIISKVWTNNGKHVKLKAKYEKLYNDDIELMYNFIKEKFNGRIWMKSINIFELQEDVANYLLK
jgi:hypothetical protein